MGASTCTDESKAIYVADLALMKDEAVSMHTPSPTSDNQTLVLTTTNKTSQDDRLISDDMGIDVVQILVGAEKKVFTIHKDLLLATGDAFVKAFDPKKNTKGRITMSHKSPEVVKLFIEFIYTRHVPAVTSLMSESSKSIRIRNLCQLYVFAEELDLQPIIRNQIFDKIQDGFLLIGKLPDASLISSIYRNTPVASHLRKFVAACLVYQVRSSINFEMDFIIELFKTNEDIMKDFLAMVHYFIPDQDPRIRNYERRQSYIECYNQSENTEISSVV
ncbi:putative btb poz domain containing protein [Erysiphe neolycopersici]|uniref:Putative btb poz domain containing protein n=1 Tax=Erysiphe neolycopersici TaxID=212602 RepID=A0A420HV08_9PEZI|nr:putative btb poz domain containing protein [Erysiphe neolycopersici]